MKPEKKVDVWSVLSKRYPSNEYALMAEVSDDAGFGRSRSADYIAVNLWPSRGLTIEGIELKSYRSDWLNELKNPKKAENIFQYCDYFWLLTASEDIAKAEEIPDTWGWMCIKGEKIFIKKDAPKLEPKQVTRGFLCAMLKRACDRSDFIHKDSIQEAIEEAKERAKTNDKYLLDRANKELNELREKVMKFEKASGISLEFRWRDESDKIGKAVKFINDGGADGERKKLIQLEATAKRIVEYISNNIEILNVTENVCEE